MLTQTEFLKSLSKTIKLNAYGLPEGIYRPDLLPALPDDDDNSNTNTKEQEILLPTNANEPFNLPTIAAGRYSEVATQLGLPIEYFDKVENEIEASFIPLDYSEGFPSFSGKPFWIQMDYEPTDAYLNFQAYMEQAAKEGMRQLFTLNTPVETDISILKEQAALYYWDFRVKAYDLFKIVHRRKERERRAMEVEDSHFLFANRMLSICEAYMNANEEEIKESMSVKNLVEMVKLGTELQRISVGLPANGPSATQASKNTTEGTSTEIILRSIAQQNTLPQETQTSDSNNDAQSQLMAMQSLLADPEALSLAQELIVKVTKQSSTQTGG